MFDAIRGEKMCSGVSCSVHRLSGHSRTRSQGETCEPGEKLQTIDRLVKSVEHGAHRLADGQELLRSHFIFFE